MEDQLEHVATPASPEIHRRIVHFQILTVSWMAIEAIVALGAAWRSRSPALLGFGGDSAIELFSAIIVLWRFLYRSDSVGAETIAARIAGGLLFILTGLVILSSGLSILEHHEPQPSFVGIGLLLAASVGMPWLANQKRKLAARVASAALSADATESAICGYLSVIALAGLLANAAFHAPWADPMAALALVPLIAKEGWQAFRTSRHGCDCSL